MQDLKELKKLSSEYTVLYVEDDKDIAKTLMHYLSKLFKDVVYAENGEEGVKQYKEQSYDIVITDIMMPKLDGLEMSKQIKEINPNQNIIVVSAYAEIENFLNSIKLGIDGYIIKPVNYTDMNNTIYKTVSKIKAFKDNLEYEKKLKEVLARLQIDNDQLKQFTDVIEKVAIVSRTDPKGVITYVNDFFVDVSGYEKEELIGQTHNIVRHPDMSRGVYQELWETIQKGEIWEGTIKNMKKDSEAYFVHAVIIPLFDIDNNINEYIGIRFLTTEEEKEKRKFKKNVMTNYLEFKKTNINAIERIGSLDSELEALKKENEILSNKYMKIEAKYIKDENQIQFYEDEIKGKDGHYQKILNMQKGNMQKISESHKNSLHIIEKQKQEIHNLLEEQEAKRREVIKINSQLNEQTNIILDLRDTIKNINEENDSN